MPSSRPRLVLFVCYGNICRSPYAEVVFRRLLSDDEVVVQSAGFVGPGREVPVRGQRVARRRGANLSTHRSQQLTADTIQAADLIVVMSPQQRRWLRQQFGRREGVVVLGDFDPAPIDTRAVVDPVDRSEAVFDAVYERMDRCLAELAREVAATRPAAVSLPVADRAGGPGPAGAIDAATGKRS